MKNFLIIAALAVASLSVAGAKSYEIVLNHQTLAGQTTLAAGHYRVKLNGSNLEFVNVQSKKSTSVPVKVENGASKFEYTAVDTKTNNGVDQIESIQLQDSNTKLAF